MNTLPEIAKAILERRNRMTHVVLKGEIQASIGADGLGEALKHRWLVPDYDGGNLCVTNDLHALNEMQTISEMSPEQFKGQPLPVAESHGAVIAHANRRAINEIAPPATGKPSPGLSTVQPPSAAVPAGARTNLGPGVGDPVAVAENGRQFTGTIKAVGQDGRYTVSFGNERPVNPNKTYTKEELRAMTPGAAPGTMPPVSAAHTGNP